jgi:hypothetical protein
MAIESVPARTTWLATRTIGAGGAYVQANVVPINAPVATRRAGQLAPTLRRLPRHKPAVMVVRVAVVLCVNGGGNRVGSAVERAGAEQGAVG